MDGLSTGMRVMFFLESRGSPSLTECQYWMVFSTLNRWDTRTAEMYLRDWKKLGPDRQKWVTKFVPGDHYHALGEKFDRYDKAVKYLHRKGYDCLGLQHKYVYPNEGD